MVFSWESKWKRSVMMNRKMNLRHSFLITAAYVSASIFIYPWFLCWSLVAWVWQECCLFSSHFVSEMFFFKCLACFAVRFVVIVFDIGFFFTNHFIYFFFADWMICKFVKLLKPSQFIPEDSVSLKLAWISIRDCLETIQSKKNCGILSIDSLMYWRCFFFF